MDEYNAFMKNLSNSGEFADLAAQIIGVKEIRVAFCGNNFRLDISNYPPLKREDKINIAAFNFYFYKNYGYHSNGNYHCDFKTLHEAFYYLLKAWYKWNCSLDTEIKKTFLDEYESLKDDTEEDVRSWKEFWMRP